MSEPDSEKQAEQPQEKNQEDPVFLGGGETFDLWRSRASKNDELMSPELKGLAQQAVDNQTELYLTYHQIHEAAEADKPVTAQHFSDAEVRYIQESVRIDTLANKEMYRIAFQTAEPTGVVGEGEGRKGLVDRITGFLKSVQDGANRYKELQHNYDSEKDAALFNWKMMNSDVVQEIRDTEPLTHSLRRALEGSEQRKNIILEDGVDTQEGLVRELLKKNRGVAFGDVHVFAQSSHFIAENMASFKEAGVDTLYVEFPEKDFKQIEAMSVEECKQLMRDRKFGSITLPTANEIASAYGTKSADDMALEWLGMITAAKEQGVRVVNVDKQDAVRDIESLDLGAHRIASTNLQWTANIEADRKKLQESNQGDGKFIVFGGMAHFLNRDNSHGMVDDMLGIPVVQFEKSKPTAIAFRQGISPNGADFYLSGGERYLDTRSAVRAVDFDQMADGLETIQWMPGVNYAIDALRVAERQSRAEVLKSMGFDHEREVEAKPDIDLGEPANIPEKSRQPVQNPFEQPVKQPLEHPPQQLQQQPSEVGAFSIVVPQTPQMKNPSQKIR